MNNCQKWTYYHKIAEDIVNKAISAHQLPNHKCVTEHLAIHRNKKNTVVDFDNHLFIYGTDSKAILQLQENEPELKEELYPDYNYTFAEVVWAIREEMTMKVEDVLARRVRLLFLDTRAAIACADKVAHILAKELGHDENWIKNQLSEFKTIANAFLLKEFRIP